MSQKLIPTCKPCTLDDVLDRDNVPGWAARVHSAVQRDGQALRVGADNSIEAKCLHTNVWQPILLPGGGTQFDSAETAHAVLQLIAHYPYRTPATPEQFHAALMAEEEAKLSAAFARTMSPSSNTRRSDAS